LDTSRGAQMPEWMWIIISVAGGAGVIVLLWAVVTRGITASHGRTSIVIAGKMQDPDDPINKALQYVQRSTPEIQHIMFRRYLRLLKEAGADPDYLSDYDDARFVRVLLRYLVNGGNGWSATQTSSMASSSPRFETRSFPRSSPCSPTGESAYRMVVSDRIYAPTDVPSANSSAGATRI
jgi:hypothetical protein